MFTIRPRRAASSGTASWISAIGAPALTGKDAAEPLDVEVHQRSDAAKLRGVVDEHVQAAELARRGDQSRRAPRRR